MSKVTLGGNPIDVAGRFPQAGEAAAYLDAMRNAANFAFGNRLFLGLMAVRALREALGGWLFVPRLKAGEPVESTVRVPIGF